MKSVSKDLEALDQAGAGAAEIGIAIDEKDSAVARTRQPAEPGLGEQDGEILTDAWDVKPAAGKGRVVANSVAEDKKYVSPLSAAVSDDAAASVAFATGPKMGAVTDSADTSFKRSSFRSFQ